MLLGSFPVVDGEVVDDFGTHYNLDAVRTAATAAFDASWVMNEPILDALYGAGTYTSPKRADSDGQR